MNDIRAGSIKFFVPFSGGHKMALARIVMFMFEATGQGWHVSVCLLLVIKMKAFLGHLSFHLIT